MFFKAASLSQFRDAWHDIGAPDYVLDWVSEGVPIPFTSIQPAFYVPNRELSKPHSQFVSSELEQLLKTGVVSESTTRPTCVSGLGVVPKRGGKLRLVVDLRKLNEHCNPPKFRYEDIEAVCDPVQSGDNLLTLDLQNGFYHIPVKAAHRKFLGIQWKGRYYTFNVLPFGANFSPYYFCKVVWCVVQYLRGDPQRLCLASFMDDFLLMCTADSFEQNKECFISTLERLGWYINWDKSSLCPTTDKLYIGYNILTDTSEGVPIIKIATERVRKLKRDIRRVLRSRTITARGLARIAGQCISMTKVILPAKLLLRNVYHVLKSRSSWNCQLCLDSGAQKDLQFWLANIEAWNGRISATKPVDIQAMSDASSTGWGFACLGQEAAGLWDDQMSSEPSNLREMMAILMGLLSFQSDLAGKSLQVLSDNVSTVANINFQGGPSQQLTHAAWAIWSVALRNNITLTMRYLRGVDNVQADTLSRLQDNYDWQLHPAVFQALDEIWGPHTVDRFADLNNTQLPMYNSRYKDPQSSGVDALSQGNWVQHNNSVCPPFRLLPRILQVLRDQRAVATVVAPWWPAQHYHQHLLAMSVAPPIRLPVSPTTVLCHTSFPEPLRNRKSRIFAWRLSGAAGLGT